MIFYAQIGISTAIMLFLIGLFTSKLGDEIEELLPRSQYIDNENSIQETGRPSGYFMQRNYPDLYNDKYIIIKNVLKKDVFVWCCIFVILIFIVQSIAHVILFSVAFLNTHHPTTEKYFYFTTLIIDGASFIASAISIISVHINSIKKEIEHIKSIYSYRK